MADGPVERCGSCGCGYLTPVLDLGEQPLPQAVPGHADGKRYPLRLARCVRCSLVQLDYAVPQEELFSPGYPYATGNTKALREHFAEQARYVAGLLAPGDLVVDVGGNDGTMLEALRQAAPEARLLLVEPTDQARKAAAAGIDVAQEFWTVDLAMRAAREHGAAKVITASNVLGHAADPNGFLDAVNVLLAMDGTLVIDNQDWHAVVQDLQVDTVYHEHLRYWTPLSLSYLLNEHGLLVTSWNRTGMHGGAFRATARRLEEDLGQRAWQAAARLRDVVRDAAAAGPVYAVGAPTRATTLVNYARIGKHLACACEIAGSEKIGGFIPGTLVPVVDEQKLFDDQPPHALILAWDLAGDLIPKLREKGYKGKFILPLPEPRVLDD